MFTFGYISNKGISCKKKEMWIMSNAMYKVMPLYKPNTVIWV